MSELVRKAIRRAALGPDDLPQQCVVGLGAPQREITVELHGRGAPRDVTGEHLMACAAPFAIGIGAEKGMAGDWRPGTSVSLQFRERGPLRRLLGNLDLRYFVRVAGDRRDVCCFTLRDCSNYCLPRMRVWARYLYWAYLRRRRPPDIRMTPGDIHAVPVAFICPRPVALVSVVHGGSANLFPMNLMGPLGDGEFAFALNNSRPAASLVARAGRLALSSVPVEQAEMVRRMGGNHKREKFRFQDVPFPMTVSDRFGLPVPRFAMRVQELEVVNLRQMGSHTLFVARTLQDCRLAHGLEFFMVHGIYQAWRQRELTCGTASRTPLHQSR